MFRDNVETAALLLAGALASQGATVSTRVNTPPPTTGYAVSLRDSGEVTTLREFSLHRAIAWLERHRTTLSQDGVYAGIWVDAGQVWLDATRVYADEGEAWDASNLAGQVAYFDLGEHRTIYV